MEGWRFTEVPIFIQKLWRMINYEETADVISWSESGKSFIIQKKGDFITKILPMYFKHSNISSFTRQLNFYNFRKICLKSPELVEYQHKYFQKDTPNLLKLIKRKTPVPRTTRTNQNDVRALTNLSSELTFVRKQQEEIDNKIDLLQQKHASLLQQVNNIHIKQNMQTKFLKKTSQILIPLVKKCHPSNTNNVSKMTGFYQNNAPKINYCNWAQPTSVNYMNTVTVPRENCLDGSNFQVWIPNSQIQQLNPTGTTGQNNSGSSALNFINTLSLPQENWMNGSNCSLLWVPSSETQLINPIGMTEQNNSESPAQTNINTSPVLQENCLNSSNVQVCFPNPETQSNPAGITERDNKDKDSLDLLLSDLDNILNNKIMDNTSVGKRRTILEAVSDRL